MTARIYILTLAVLLLTACKTKERIVTVEMVRTDTTYITRHERDSIHEHDSIRVNEQQRGDTIFVEVSRWRTKYVERQVHDTCYVATHDTVPQPYPVEVEVPGMVVPPCVKAMYLPCHSSLTPELSSMEKSRTCSS